MQVLLDLNDMQESLKSNGYTNRKLATRFSSALSSSTFGDTA
ncbi:Prophage helix-turn-helix protein [Bacillus cereus Rock3-28]|nr:Prophage helix-turn-helix protein [Bacillus cereus Rock3-28]